MCYPQQLGRSWKVFGYLPRNFRESHQPSVPEPSGTFRNLPEPSGMLDATVTFTRAAGLAIDWSKTWWWVNDNSQASLVSEAIHSVAPVSVQRHTSATDLGFQMQYGAKNRLGILAQRLQTGYDRIARLGSMTCPLSVKEHMLTSSIYPATFHGFEIKPPPQDAFQKLRAKASRALLGQSTTLSPSIALLFGLKGILDPEFHYVCKLLSCVRLFLLRLSPQRVLDFCYLASHFVGSLHSVHGPAAALGFTLRILGWQLDSSGHLHVSTFISVDLTCCSLQRFRRCLIHAWQYQLVRSTTSRYSWFSFPDISIIDTRQVLSLFADPQRSLLIQEIAGGYQLAGQKGHWLETSDGTCEFCGGIDSRAHRLAECPLGAEIREPFRSLFDFIDSTGAGLLDFPVVCVHPHMEFLRTMHFQFQMPTWQPDILAALHHCVQSRLVPSFYTDGSCQFPAEPTCRFSAFAVVWDLCQSDAERIVFADACRYQGDFTKCFQIVTAAKTPGEQDILRAELAAATNVIEQFHVGRIFIDSQSAMSLSELALRAASPLEFAGKDHYDLLYRIWMRRNQVSFQLFKVKSHLGFHDIKDPLARFHAMGNSYADSTAVSTRDKMLPSFVSDHLTMQSEISADKDNLYSLFKLHLLLLAARGRAKPPQEGTQVVQNDFDKVWRAFRTWVVLQPSFQVHLPDPTLLQFCSFGHRLARITFDWIQQVRWPDSDQGPLDYKPGMAWLEMGLSWMCFHKAYLPVIRQDHLGDKRVVQIASYEEACEHGLTYTECGAILEKLLGNVQGLVPQKLYPALQRQKASSLYNLGAPKYHQGFSIRPQLPAQETVFEILHGVLVGTTSGKGLQGTPKLEGASGPTGALAEIWKTRSCMALTAMAKAHVARKRLG